MNKYGGVQAARFGGNQQLTQAQQQQMMMGIQQDMNGMDEMESYGDEYGDYDEEMDNMVASGDTEGGGALIQYGN